MNGKKLVEILITVKYFRRNNKIFQHFIYDSKYINGKYLIYYKFLDKIKSLSLISEFLAKRVEKDRIVLEWADIDEKPKNFFFVLNNHVPPFDGCDYCRLLHKKEGFVIFFSCSFQNNKLMNRRLKSCRFFQEKEDE